MYKKLGIHKISRTAPHKLTSILNIKYFQTFYDFIRIIIIIRIIVVSRNDSIYKIDLYRPKI